jgi:hypothetical protein
MQIILETQEDRAVIHGIKDIILKRAGMGGVELVNKLSQAEVDKIPKETPIEE